MTDTTPEPTAEGPRRKEIAAAVAWTALRLFVGFWVIFGVLELVPEEADGRFALPLVVAVVAIIAYIWFFRRQLRLISQARFPTMRAVEALILVAGMFLALFSMIYVMVSYSDPSSFTEVLDAFTGYYFALTVLATVGFGDITPTTTLARSITMVQMSLDLAFIAVIIRIFTSSARRALLARSVADAPAPQSRD